MNKNIIGWTVATVLLIVLGIVLILPSRNPLGAGQGDRATFDQITLATTTTVSTGGVLVVPDDNGNKIFVSLVNSGSNGISCFPSATTTGYTYGGGWYLAPSGGAITFDGVSIYVGKISCLTGTGTSTLGVVTR